MLRQFSSRVEILLAAGAAVRRRNVRAAATSLPWRVENRRRWNRDQRNMFRSDRVRASKWWIEDSRRAPAVGAENRFTGSKVGGPPAFSVTTSAISGDWLKQFRAISTRRPEMCGSISYGFESATIWKATNDLRRSVTADGRNRIQTATCFRNAISLSDNKVSNC